MEYKVIGNIRHNGIDYKQGDIIKLNEESAKLLVESGTLESIKGEETVEKTEEKEVVEPKIKKEGKKKKVFKGR